MTNRLALERSPYLLQHAENPVDWYPWGEEALSRARAESKPILLSVGYSACHWCHVMAHESFEDDSVAAFMNEHFINIKVDREERPDVDSIYMDAVQALTGSGGWPLNVFLTPDGRPFFGGTYYPPRPAHGRASWLQVLQGVAQTVQERGDDVEHNASILIQHLHNGMQRASSEQDPDESILRDAYGAMTSQVDLVDGGFGQAPKFPQPLALEFVLRMHSRYGDAKALEFLELTLRRLADGGIYDQLGGGFHRYSVDGVWLVPHFEKMLYDNALLARLFTLVYTATGDERYRRVAEETLDYLLRDLRSNNGTFFSAQDADSEGIEGKYYLWSESDLQAVLDPDDAATITALFSLGVPGSSPEAEHILRRGRSRIEVAHARDISLEQLEVVERRALTAMLRARGQRVPPQTDTKVLAGWNALAIRAFALAGRVFDRADYRAAAERAMKCILTEMRPGGTLMRTYYNGPGTVPGFLEDYAYVVEALLELAMTGSGSHYQVEAQRLADDMISMFWNAEKHAFFDVATASDTLIVRPRNLFDNPIPSGNSSACFALLKLAALTGDQKYTEPARSLFQETREFLVRAPLGVAYALCALDFSLSQPVQVGIAGDPDGEDANALMRTVYERYLPNAVLSVGLPDSVPLLKARDQIGGRATAYLCRDFACRLPVTDPALLADQLGELLPSPA